MELKTWVLATRPWSFTMTAISVTVGAAIAAREGFFHGGLYVLTLLGAVALHAATNMINDYYDVRRGVDKPGAPTTLYRPHPLVSGLLTPSQVLWSSLALYAIAVAIGIYLVVLRGLPLLLIGLAGVLASFFYTANPIQYKYFALGELSVFLMWGPLMVGGAYLVQMGQLSTQAVWISIPFGILVALVLLANNLRDIQYDSTVGIKTLGTLLKERRTMWLYQVLMGSAYLGVILLIATAQLSWRALLIFLTLPLAFKLVRTLQQAVPEDADARTAQLDTAFGVLLILALVLDKLF